MPVCVTSCSVARALTLSSSRSLLFPVPYLLLYLIPTWLFAAACRGVVVCWPVKTFSPCCKGTLTFIAVLTRVHFSTLLWAICIQLLLLHPVFHSIWIFFCTHSRVPSLNSPPNIHILSNICHWSVRTYFCGYYMMWDPQFWLIFDLIYMSAKFFFFNPRCYFWQCRVNSLPCLQHI